MTVRRAEPLVTTGSRGLQEDSFPFRLYQKAKRLEAAAHDSMFGPDHHADIMNFTARQLAARMEVLKKAQEKPFDELFGLEESEHVG
ncbi:hypothetical protein [Geobacillus zalihae]|uniref:hypothetical protein n=1 Tax=Geobacillus zalihae TaxID=213419 RepID=UPI001F609C54|nr:hypothetical protein [Geobacillus zalihae]